MTRPYIDLDGVSKVYETKGGLVEACADVNLEIGQSEFVAIVGPSGCGKTTILKMVAGLVPYSSGTITMGGRVVDRPQTDVGIVFQEPVRHPLRTPRDAVMLQPDARRLHRPRAGAVARPLATRPGLGGFGARRPYELAGGWRGCVGIGRARSHDPPLLLMDEPFG